jgi:hypothetical protein
MKKTIKEYAWWGFIIIGIGFMIWGMIISFSYPGFLKTTWQAFNASKFQNLIGIIFFVGAYLNSKE